MRRRGTSTSNSNSRTKQENSSFSSRNLAGAGGADNANVIIKC